MPAIERDAKQASIGFEAAIILLSSLVVRDRCREPLIHRRSKRMHVVFNSYTFACHLLADLEFDSVSQHSFRAQFSLRTVGCLRLVFSFILLSSFSNHHVNFGLFLDDPRFRSGINGDGW